MVNFLGRFAARRRRLARLEKGAWRGDGDSEAAALCGAPYGECSSARGNSFAVGYGRGSEAGAVLCIEEVSDAAELAALGR